MKKGGEQDRRFLNRFPLSCEIFKNNTTFFNRITEHNVFIAHENFHHAKCFSTFLVDENFVFIRNFSYELEIRETLKKKRTV